MKFSHLISRILYIEDDEGLARLLQKRLDRSGILVSLASSAEEGQRLIASEPPFDVILIDYYLPGMSGLDLIKQLDYGSSDTPLILLTASGSERIAIDAMEAGAADYVVKDTGQTYIELLPSVMAAAYTRMRLTLELQEQQNLLREYANRLEQSEQRLNLAIEGSRIGIWDWNLKDNTLYWSLSLKKAHRLRDNETPTYEFWRTQVHPEDLSEVEKRIQDYLKGDSPEYNITYREINAASIDAEDWQWTHSRGVALRDDAGVAYRLLGSCMDITEQKRLEVQLAHEKARAEEASQAKSEFLATMSHEIRTPMNAVVGLAGLLEKTELNARQHEMIQTLQSNAEVLLRLINDLLDISRIEAGQLRLEKRAFRFSEILNDIRSMFAEQAAEKRLALEIVDNTEDITFYGDSARIHQIIMNLSGNALKFTNEGAVTVTSSFDPAAGIATVTVKDTGIGITDDKLATVFEKFVQADQSISRRFGGSGLGLSICKTLAEIMGGEITASSQAEEGSIFTVRLPLPVYDPQKSESITSVAESPEITNQELSGTERILLVEDYPANIMVATMMLEELGYLYDVVQSGLDAIETIKKAASPYSAVLMDVQMPEMDGFEATRRIREWEVAEERPRQYIIGLTAHALAGDRERCLKAGMDDYMTKPVQPDILSAKLRRQAVSAA